MPGRYRALVTRRCPAWIPVLVLVLTVAQLAVAEYVPGIERFADKAFAARLIAYPLLMLVVPFVWWVVVKRRHPDRYPPYGAFTLVMLPFLVDVTGNSLNFPLIADPDRSIATLYDMIHPNASDTATVRSVFVIGPDHKVKLTLTYPASTGRNFQELLRVIDSLQLTARHAVATPADWKPGEDVIIVPAVSDEDARKKYPAGFTAKKPYLRVVPQPAE